MQTVSGQEGVKFDKGLDYCELCPFHPGTPVTVPINTNAKLIVLGEGPGATEEDLGVPFVGRSGRELNRNLKVMHIPRNQLHITNATLCRPPRKKTTAGEWKKAHAACRLRLHKELEAVRKASGCSTILALGAQALHTTTAKPAKIQSWMGTVYEGAQLAPFKKRAKIKQLPGLLANFKNFQTVGTYHPAFLVRGNLQYRQPFRAHLYRAWKLAHSELKDWKWPEIIIEPGLPMLNALRAMVWSNERLGFDVETLGDDPIKDQIMCLSFSDRKQAISVAWENYIAKGGEIRAGIFDNQNVGFNAEIVKLVIQILKDPAIEKVMHNGIYDALSIKAKHGFDIEGYTKDTLLQHVVRYPGLRHGLGFVASIFTNSDRWKDDFGVIKDDKGADSFSAAPEPALLTYNAKDSASPVRMSYLFDRQLKRMHCGESLYDTRLTMMKVGGQMQYRGVMVNMKKVGKYQEQLEAAAAVELKRMRKLIGSRDFNPRSRKQLEHLFFEVLKAPVLHYTREGNPCLNKEVLEKYLAYPDKDVANLSRSLRKYRTLKKYSSTYCENFKHRVGPDQILHPPWRSWGTVSGRWSSGREGSKSRDVPIQCIPTGRDGSLSMRDIFIARPGSYFVVADYDRLEMWIIAHLSGCPDLMAAFAKNADAHTLNAMKIYGKHFGLDQDGKPCEKARKHHRAITKNGFFQTMYMYSRNPKSLYRKLVINAPHFTIRAADQFIRNTFASSPALDAWQKNTVEEARRTGYIECPLSGRRRMYEDKKIKPDEVLNYAVQGTGADLLDGAIKRIAPELNWTTEGIIAQAHDEIVLEGPDPQRLVDLCYKHMSREVELNGFKSRFPIEVKVGKDWKNTELWGD